VAAPTVHRRSSNASQAPLDDSAFENILFQTEDEKSTGAPIAWDTDHFDITEDGIYFIAATFMCDGNSASEIWLRFAKNGTTNLTHNEGQSANGYAFMWKEATGNGDENPASIAAIAELADGDTIDIQAKGSKATGMEIDGATVSILQLSTISAGTPRRVMVIS